MNRHCWNSTNIQAPNSQQKPSTDFMPALRDGISQHFPVTMRRSHDGDFRWLSKEWPISVEGKQTRMGWTPFEFTTRSVDFTLSVILGDHKFQGQESLYSFCPSPRRNCRKKQSEKHIVVAKKHALNSRETIDTKFSLISKLTIPMWTKSLDFCPPAMLALNAWYLALFCCWNCFEDHSLVHATSKAMVRLLESV